MEDQLKITITLEGAPETIGSFIHCGKTGLEAEGFPEISISTAEALLLFEAQKAYILLKMKDE